MFMENNNKDLFESIQKVKNNYDDLYVYLERLGNGNLNENLSFYERNELIDNVLITNDKIKDLNKKINERLSIRESEVKGLKIKSNVNLNAFKDIIKDDDNKYSIIENEGYDIFKEQ